jgi:hypothetical protein
MALVQPRRADGVRTSSARLIPKLTQLTAGTPKAPVDLDQYLPPPSLYHPALGALALAAPGFASRASPPSEQTPAGV